MNLYELITPSDPITFKAEDDKVAFFCAVYLGGGKAGCENAETRESIPSLLLFVDDQVKYANDYLGVEIEKFTSDNLQKIADCFHSFAYVSARERRTYDDAVGAITDPNKLKEFKTLHEDRNRTSMSKWVQDAWQYGDFFQDMVGKQNIFEESDVVKE